jgi:anti-anti-sigma factor
MSSETETATESAEMVVECSDSLDVSVAADFKTLLQQAVSQNAPVVLDATQLVRIDGAALQLLTAFFIEAKESGINVTWRAPSESLLHTVQLTGLKDALQL